MIYDFCNTYTIQKYCAVEANSLSEAIEKVKLSGNKFERRNDKETLINSKYRYVNDWKKLDFVIRVSNLMSPNAQVRTAVTY